jgi:hypothetical protein
MRPLESVPFTCERSTPSSWAFCLLGPRSVGLLLLSLLLLLTAGSLLGLLEHLVYVLCQPEVLSRLI